MIYDKLQNLSRYRGLSPALDKVIHFLATTDLSSLPVGRIEIDGDSLYANHFSYDTVPFSKDLAFEAHNHCLDLHIDISGCERIGLTPIEKLTQTKALPQEDAVLFTGVPEATLSLNSELFLLLYPGEGHLPKLAEASAAHVDKLVVKIPY